MDIKNATFWRPGTTKKELLEMPKNIDCSIRVSIGAYGIVDMNLWARNGSSPFASITLDSANEMKALAATLTAIADAKIAADA